MLSTDTDTLFIRGLPDAREAAGPRLLRLARSGDERPLAELLARIGLQAPPEELRELARHDPRRAAVVCATEFAVGRERIVGVGRIRFEPPRAPRGARGASAGRSPAAVQEPDLILVDPGAGAELAALLARGLRNRAVRHARRRSPHAASSARAGSQHAASSLRAGSQHAASTARAGSQHR
jgi:hypothetical protein